MRTQGAPSAGFPSCVVVAVAVALLAGDCSKSRADDFSRFRPSQSLGAAGKTPRTHLRYQPAALQKVTYQLFASLRCPALELQAKMRLRVVLGFSSTAGTGGPFKLRLLSILRLDPPPPGGRPELGPAYVLLEGILGPRGELAELQSGDQLPSPVNLALVAPLLLPAFPKDKVGVGAHWRSARRHDWKRQRSADQLTGRAGYRGSTTVLLRTRYRYESPKSAGGHPVITAASEIQLRSRTQTLGHTTRHDGSARATARYELDPDTGLPDLASVKLEGTYQLRANDKTLPVKETLEITLRRER